MGYNSSQRKLKKCPNCFQQYDEEDGESVCPYCGYSENEAVPSVICPECGKEFEPVEGELMCPFCVCDDFDEPETVEAEEAEATAQAPSVICPECGKEFEPVEGELMCPFCGCDDFDEPEAAEAEESEATAQVPSVICPECGGVFAPVEGELMCPFCGCDDFDEPEAQDAEEAEEAESEAAESDSNKEAVQENPDKKISDTDDLSELFADSDEERCFCYGCMQEIVPGTEYCPYCGYDLSETVAKYYLKPGTVLSDRYIVGVVLGAGGFGATYIGWDTQLARKVAVKEYLPTDFATRNQGETKVIVNQGEKGEQFYIGKEKFKEEGQILAGCHDVSGIVRIYDVLSENETVYLIMEYLNGETLKTRLEREGTLSPREATKIMSHVLEALEGVHGFGLLHRDVAPDNIFLCQNGDVKLIDFGAARYATSNYSRSLSVILKPGFSPEEQYRSKGQQGAWTDVYAAGATLFKMITGVTPPESVERIGNDELRGSAGVPEWIASADKKYRHIKYLLASRVYKIMTGRKSGEPAADSFELINKDKKSERRQSMALSTFRRLTGSSPDAVNFNEESYAANEKIKSIPRPIYIAMMNAMNVNKDDRTQSAEQFRKELTGETTPVLIKLKNNKVDIGAFPKWFKAAGAIAAAVVVLLAVSISSIIVTATSNQVTTPEIINLMTDEAEKLLLDNELEYMIVDSKVSDKVPENKVMFQEPEALTKVEKGSVVKATISMGTENVSVPNFIGMTKDEAIAELKVLQLAYTFEEEYSSVEKGRICLQNKETGTRIPVGTTVSLTVSLGLEDVNQEEDVTVPKVTDFTLEEAKSRLEAVCLYLSVESEQYDEKPAGTVISQSVKTGSTVKQGTTIKVVISKGKEMVVVPYVTYKTENEATKLLEKAKLHYAVTYEFHDTIVKGNVISQSIAAEKSVAHGTTVDLVVSKGKKTVAVPNVVGKKSQVAANLIIEKGLKVVIKEETNDSVDAGKVIRQSPEAKKEVDNGSTVTIYVSKGKNSVTIPSVAGQSRAEAEANLEEKGFQVNLVERYSDTVEPGDVISQSPSANSLITKGSTVTIFVSKGIQPVTVPDVVGKSAESAHQSIVMNLDLVLVIMKDYSSTVASGYVIRQSPEAGTTVKKGDTVKVVISMGKVPTTVPDVVGKTKSSAKSSIESADLSVVFAEEYSETVASGKVISQTPTGGSSAGKGDSVTVTVSKGRQPITVPNVVGKSKSSAESSLTSAGFNVSFVEGYSDTVAAGNVIKQSPSGNVTAYRDYIVTVTVSKGKSEWSGWVPSLPSGVSASNGYEIDDSGREYKSRTVSITTVREISDWSNWSIWTTERQSIDNPDTKEEDTKQQYRYYRFVCPNCGADWYGYTTCMSCGQAMYVYGSRDWGTGIKEGVHYMWYDLPKDSISWSRATSDNTAVRASLGTGVYWYYFNNKPGDYYWSRTLYRYRARTIADVEHKTYGDWSEWSSTPATSSSTMEVRTRTMYRYRIKPVS